MKINLNHTDKDYFVIKLRYIASIDMIIIEKEREEYYEKYKK